MTRPTNEQIKQMADTIRDYYAVTRERCNTAADMLESLMVQQEAEQ